MRVILAAGVALMALAACGPAAETPTAADAADAAPAPLTAELADGPEPDAVPTDPATCTDILAVIATFDEPTPFTTLRSGKVKLGDRELDDKFTTAIKPAGATCDIGALDGFGPTPGKMHVMNCTLFTSGMIDREENAKKARAVFNVAKDTFSRCLPDTWTARDGSQTEVDSTEAMIYETRADAERALTASYYVYPIELRKEWADGNVRGQMPGWRVTLNFQKEIGAAPAAP